MKFSCGVLTLLTYAIHDHRERFKGKDPNSFWISRETMNNLAYEIGMVPDELVSIELFNIPVHVTIAEIPYLRNHICEMEPL